MSVLDTIKCIAIIDDEQTALEASIYDVEEMGKSTYVLKGRYSSPDDVLTEIRGKAEAVLCDHRLGHGAAADFDGASLAAFLYSRKVPAVLMTQFYEIDRDVSIRRWRRNIPSLVSKKVINSDSLIESFTFCCAELAGTIVAKRRAHAALFEILSRTSESGEDVVDIILPAWNSKQAIRIPVSLFADIPSERITVGTWFTAAVNIGAEKDEDLFFETIGIAPPVDNNDGLA